MTLSKFNTESNEPIIAKSAGKHVVENEREDFFKPIIKHRNIKLIFEVMNRPFPSSPSLMGNFCHVN